MVPAGMPDENPAVFMDVAEYAISNFSVEFFGPDQVTSYLLPVYW